jgi:hypothetical protein
VLMLALTKEAYAQVVVFCPYGNAHGGIVLGVRGVDPRSDEGGAAPVGGVMGCPVGILPLAKLILHRSLARKSVSASG